MKTTIYKEHKVKIVYLSYCCGELPMGELDQGHCGFCSKCKDGTLFEEHIECPNCGELKIISEGHKNCCEKCNDSRMN